MIHDLRPYSAYRDSGVPWLRKVPEHWEVSRLKARLLRNDAGVWGDDFDENGTPVLRSTEQTINGGWRISTPARIRLSQSQRDAALLLEGDLVITKSSGSHAHIGKTSLVTRDIAAMHCCHSNFMQRLRPNGHTLPAMVWRFLNSPVGREQMVFQSTTTTGLGNLNGTILGNCVLAFPPLPEQAAIVRFLDHADRRIRRYIRAKQKLIKLLEEQKQIIIHRAVTCGLDPNVRLRPSGVEWLGEVPEHWEVRRNGQLFAQHNQTGFAELPILEVSLKTGVRIREFENAARKQVMSDREKYKRAAKGDIAYNMMRMWQGAVGVAPVDGLVSPAYVVARPLPGVEVRYFASLFRTAAYMGEVDNCSRGIVKDRNRLYWQDFKQSFSPYPPPAEQVQIADAIDESTRTLQHAMDRIVREISLLREYRTRLIADVVTGKLDVREAAESLPDLPVESSVEIGPDDEIVASPEVDDTPESEDATA